MTVLLLPDPRPPTLEVAPPLTTPVQAPLPADVAAWPAGGGDADPYRRAAERMCVALLEAMAGRRPLPLLEPIVSLDVLRVAAQQARRRRRLIGRSLHISEPAPQLLEVALRVTDPVRGRDAAVALRLERRGRTWVCTALQLDAL